MLKRIIFVFFLSQVTQVMAQKEKDYVFFLHNRFLENNALNELHPEYGKAEYKEILVAFRNEGFVVISEKRAANTDMRVYAAKVKKQVDSLLGLGVKADHITVIGTSKGGYIAQYVSTLLANPHVNFVFIGCFLPGDMEEFPYIRYHGNILSIYERSDVIGVSAVPRTAERGTKITRFKEIELNTGRRHGFLYHPMKEWIVPCVRWARRKYD